MENQQLKVEQEELEMMIRNLSLKKEMFCSQVKIFDTKNEEVTNAYELAKKSLD